MWLQILGCVLALFLTKAAWRRWKYDLHRIPSPPAIQFFVELIQMIRKPGNGDLSMLRGRWWKKLGCPKLMKVGDTEHRVEECSSARKRCSCSVFFYCNWTATFLLEPSAVKRFSAAMKKPSLCLTAVLFMCASRQLSLERHGCMCVT